MSANTNNTHYYVTNEAQANELLFKDNDDYNTFIKFIKEYLDPPVDPATIKKSFTVDGKIFQGIPHLPKNYYNKISLIAYSLTNNKFNLLLKEFDNRSVISFMRSLSTRYSIYFNKKYQKVGAVFKGPYKAAQIDNDVDINLFIDYISKLSGITRYQYPDNYQIKNGELSIEEKEKIQKILFGKVQTLNEVSNQVVQSITEYLKIHQRIPELVFTTFLFLILSFLGYKNITMPNSNGTVAGVYTENTEVNISTPSTLKIDLEPNNNNVKLPKGLMRLENENHE